MRKGERDRDRGIEGQGTYGRGDVWDSSGARLHILPYSHTPTRFSLHPSIPVFAILLVWFSAVMITGLVAAQYSGDRKSTTSAITADDIYRHVRPPCGEEIRSTNIEIRKYSEGFWILNLGFVSDFGFRISDFLFIAGVNLGKKNNLATTINGRTRQWRVREDFSPMTFSTQEPVEAEVAFVGYGISASEAGYDDYAGLDVSGRVVLALLLEPEGDDPHSKFERYMSFRAKALMARQHGAKAIAFIADTDDFKNNKLSQMEFDYSFSDSDIVATGISRQLANELVATTGTSLDEWQKKINDRWTQDSRLKTQDLDKGKSLGSWVLGLGSLPGVTAKIQVDLVKDTRQAVNVVGYLEGSDPTLKDEIIIIGAHYDHLGLGGPNSLAPKQLGEVHNGADDNASGTAGVLELAQAFSPNGRARARPELKRSLLFMAFSGEEEGLLGSNYYAKHPIFPIERTVAMINMDMIGRLKENKLIVQGLGTSPQWPALIEELNKTHHPLRGKSEIRNPPGETNPKSEILQEKQIRNPKSSRRNKSEIRNPPGETNPKSKIQNPKWTSNQ